MIPAYTASASALLAVLTAMATQTEVLAGQVEQGFGQHPDAEIYRSQPGLGVILGARVLAEFGDDPGRYVDAKSAQELLRHVTDHQSLRHQTGRAGPLRPQPPPRRRAVPARRSPHSTTPQAPAPSTTGSAPAEPPTTKPCAPSRTGSSASSTAAYEPTPSTTSTSPGTPNQTNSALQLDRFRSWDV